MQMVIVDLMCIKGFQPALYWFIEEKSLVRVQYYFPQE